MSADNWSICPKCRKNAVIEKEKQAAEVISSYGKIPREKWLELKCAADTQLDLDQTLREDYEIGIDENGEFFVDYYASCNCGFKFSFTEKRALTN